MAVAVAVDLRRPIAPRLIAWGIRHGRHDLPWQHPSTPYRVWISEVMLQQTQVATVIPYFERFMQRFPDVRTLASAPLADVLALWSGLGYYARARNLHAAARHCEAVHGGELPSSLEALAALPGIGRSTAGAILALGFGRRAPILDGNASRVLARHHGVGGWPGAAATRRELWALAAAETPRRRIAVYTQAIMDLGATLCTRAAPACGACPLAPDCAARNQGRQRDYPGPRPARARPLRRRRYAWVERGGRLLLHRRPPAGVWGGLLCLPELAEGESAERWCSRTFGQLPRTVSELAGFRHEFTHFRLAARVLALDVAEGAVADAAAACWLAPDEALAAGLPAPMRDYIHHRLAATE